MEPSQICEPVQKLAGEPQEEPATQTPKLDAGEGGAAGTEPPEQTAPIAMDAPGLAPVDIEPKPAEPVTIEPKPAEPVTIELEPRPVRSLAHWIPPRTHRPRFGKSAPGTSDQTPGTNFWPASVSRFAALLMLAIAGGAIAGSLVTYWFTRAASPDQTIASNENAQLKAVIERLNFDLVSLRSTVEAANRTVGAQFARLTDRIDRSERTQTEPTAKIAKITETLERIDRRTRDLPELGPMTAEQRIPPPVPIKEISRLSVVPGWVVRNVYDGTALIQGRIGLIEVEVGDPLPGGGRVEAIRRQDGRWVVVTSKGLILAAQ